MCIDKLQKKNTHPMMKEGIVLNMIPAWLLMKEDVED